MKCVQCLFVPFRSVPFRSVPFRSVPCRAVPCRAVPFRSVPCRAVPCRAVPCRAVPCRAVPCRAVPCRAVPCRAVPCRAVLRSLFIRHSWCGSRVLNVDVLCVITFLSAVIVSTGYWVFSGTLVCSGLEISHMNKLQLEVSQMCTMSTATSWLSFSTTFILNADIREDARTQSSNLSMTSARASAAIAVRTESAIVACFLASGYRSSVDSRQ